MVSWSDLFAFAMVIIAVVKLCYEMFREHKK